MSDDLDKRLKQHAIELRNYIGGEWRTNKVFADICEALAAIREAQDSLATDILLVQRNTTETVAAIRNK